MKDKDKIISLESRRNRQAQTPDEQSIEKLSDMVIDLTKEVARLKSLITRLMRQLKGSRK
jgi:uncharacterized coiled-coil protein SlyX